MAEPTDVFISYSREDSARVNELADKLRKAGVGIWIDQSGIDGATIWSEQIVNALEQAKVLLLIVSPSSVSSHNVNKEVMLVSERKGHILPVHLEPTHLPAGLRYQLVGIHHIDYFDGDTSSGLQAILRALERAGVALRAPATTDSAADARSPRGAAAAPQSAETASGHRALAVLPFDNMSPAPETDYFSDGLTEELIARLSLVSEIELVSRWASMKFKATKLDLSEVARQLGARYVVGGTVRRFQDSVRITVQLVDTVTDRPLWGNTYKGSLDGIFDIQEQVASQIVEALKLKLTVTEKASLTKRRTDNSEAYDFCLRGQDYLYRLSKRSVEYAIQLFERAIELDPRYAAAYAGCSCAYGQLYQYFSRRDEYRAKAQEYSVKSLMYDSNLPEAYSAMGLSYFIWGTYDEATTSASKAIELDPDNYIAYWTLGRIQFATGHFEEALPLFHRVVQLKPGFYIGRIDLRQTFESLGRNAEAAEVQQQLLQQMPNYLLQNPDDARARLLYANMLVSVGRREEGIAQGDTALAASPDDSVMLYNGACLYCRLGDTARALATLREAIAVGHTDYGWMANDPALAPLRNEPEFVEIVNRR